MKLLEEKDSAMNAFRIFIRQKTLQKIYLYAIKIFGKPFVAVFTEEERVAHGLSEDHARIVYGDEQRDRDTWRKCRAIDEDPRVRKLKECVRYCRASLTAEKIKTNWEKERMTTI